MTMNSLTQYAPISSEPPRPFITSSEANSRVAPALEPSSQEASSSESPKILAVALETLHDLIQYMPILSQLSRSCVEQQAQLPELTAEYAKLIDGITIFTEAFTETKRILRLSSHPPLAILEADLLSILRDILETQERPPESEARPQRSETLGREPVTMTQEAGHLVQQNEEQLKRLYFLDLLDTHLPENLERWEKEMLPELIRQQAAQA